jgi:hypothetical protein
MSPYSHTRKVTDVLTLTQSKKEALKELTALYPYNFLDDTDYKVFQTATENITIHEDSILSSYTRPLKPTVCNH